MRFEREKSGEGMLALSTKTVLHYGMQKLRREGAGSWGADDAGADRSTEGGVDICAGSGAEYM